MRLIAGGAGNQTILLCGQAYRLKTTIMKADDVPMGSVDHRFYCASCKTGVGKEMYDKCIETVKKYPEFFPAVKHTAENEIQHENDLHSASPSS